jgi:vacuolar-type H+-ATPase subunit C/Vma6
LKSYSYLLPKLYAQKEKFLTQQTFRELCDAESVEKMAQILREHNYKINTGTKSLSDLANQLELSSQERIERIASLSPVEAEGLIRTLLFYKKTSSIILALKIFESTGNILDAVSAMPRSEGEKFRRFVEQGSLSPGMALPSIKQAFDKLLIGDEKKLAMEAISAVDEGADINTLQLSLFLKMRSSIMERIDSIGRIRREEVQKLVCPYIDINFLMIAINVAKSEKGNRAVNALLEKGHGCKLSGKDVLEALQSDSVLNLFSRVIVQYGSTIEKGQNPEIYALRFLKRKLMKEVKTRYGSYPFTPALPLSVALAIETEKEEIMKLLMGMSSGEQCSAMIGKLSY